METVGIDVVGISPTYAPDDVEVITAVECDESADLLVDSPLWTDEDDVEDDQPPTVQSSDSSVELGQRIIRQVEYYFSDANLPYDKFMMTHVRKDKEGFVPIALIASFRKMKKLTKDTSLLGDVLKESSHLVVSSDGKKVKRLHPLIFSQVKDPKLCNVVIGVLVKNCTVVIENLPEDHSKENIQRIFGEVGNIRCICICDPHVAEDSKQSKKTGKLISGKMHAFVEYETAEAAEKAAAALNDEKDWRNGLRVQLLRKRTGYGIRRKAKMGSKSHKSSDIHVSDAGVEDSNNSGQQCADSHADVEGEHRTKDRNGRKGRNQRSRGHKHHSSNGIGNGTRGAAIGEASKPPPGPRMPDGTRGFTMGRGRPSVSCQD